MKGTHCRALTGGLIACLLTLLLSITASAAETVASGDCGGEGDGTNLTWTLDSEGTLTICGRGKMAEFDYYNYYKNQPWYDYRSSLKSLVIGDGVTSIGGYAFGDCSSLTSITIPDSVTSIGGGAFSHCSGLTSITIPDGVTSIGSSAFYDCSSLTSITLPDSVTSIDSGTFSDCSSLTSITIPDSVVWIDDSAFFRCSSLTNVYITDIGAWCGIAFGGDLASPMFYAKNIYLNGSKIVSVDVLQGVTALNYTFLGFKDLVRVTLPDSVTSIGDRTFDGCSSLTSITIPDSVTSIGDRTFNGCSSLTSITIPNSVTSIGDCTFSACSSLMSITLSDSMTSIGGYAFEDCSSLMNVTIPNSVTSIGSSAFSGCISLMSITLSDSMTSIGDYAFEDCTSLTSITIPDSVTSIGRAAFSNCSNLSNVNITEESRLESIGDYTFHDCSSLTSITIPDSVTSIGDYAFGLCFSLTSITIPDGVTSIGDRAFVRCTSLTSITIPSSVTSIGERAFDMCRALTSVHITDIGAWCRIAFADDTANPLCCAKTLFVNGTKAETLEIPANVKVIPVNAFINAECIRQVALPKDLQGIAANAFSGCTGIEKVFYAGSESEWKALPIGAGNDCLKNAQIYYDSTLGDYYCRITVKVSDGGRIRVDRNTAAAGETVTVSAEPYAGYELTAIYVDGQKLEEKEEYTFTVRGNHEVSAEFTLLPVYGGTAEYRLEGITVCTAAGEKRQELTREKLLVSVQIRHMEGDSGATVMLAQYDAQGRYQGLMWLTVDEMPQGTALKATLPLDNSDGRAANLKAFVVSSVTASAPIGNAVSFGDV